MKVAVRLAVLVAVASVPATAQATVVSPKVVTPNTVTPQIVTPQTSSAPSSPAPVAPTSTPTPTSAPAPGSAPAPSQMSATINRTPAPGPTHSAETQAEERREERRGWEERFDIAEPQLWRQEEVGELVAGILNSLGAWPAGASLQPLPDNNSIYWNDSNPGGIVDIIDKVFGTEAGNVRFTPNTGVWPDRPNPKFAAAQKDAQAAATPKPEPAATPDPANTASGDVSITEVIDGLFGTNTRSLDDLVTKDQQ